jgi:RNA polymerase sigma-54 factor
MENQAQTLSLTLSQRLTLTPQLKQSIEILGLGHEDLNALLQKHTESNPFLELTKPNFQTINRYNNNIVSSNSSNTSSQTNFNTDDETEDIFNLTEAHTDYRDELHEQLYMQKHDSRTLALVQYLIENLDEHGYLETTLDDLLLSLPAQLNITLRELDNALAILQNLEPVGIGSRNIAEFFCIQLQNLALKTSIQTHKNQYLLAYYVCTHHSELLFKQQYAKIARALNMHVQDIEQTYKTIQALLPYPIQAQANFNPADNIYHITPDFFILKNTQDDGDGLWYFEMNELLIPKISINQIYAENMQSLTAENGVYVKKKIQEANWLIKSVQQRFDTITKVMHIIIEQQQAYFNYGDIAMQPLVMQNIADDLDMHVSTISRALKNKYLQCSLGIYPLSYFFSRGLNTYSGGLVSSKTICACIKHLISIEDKCKPWSDEQLLEKLNEQGMNLCRRTVAKYRKNLNIHSSSKRKIKQVK